jgi:hypothetical protein
MEKQFLETLKQVTSEARWEYSNMGYIEEGTAISLMDLMEEVIELQEKK